MEERQIAKKDLPEAKPVADRSGQMSFLDHVEELRWSIIKGCIGIGVGIIIAFIFEDFLINTILLGPAHSNFFMYSVLHIDAVDLVLQSRRLPGQFFAYWGTIFIMGVIIGSPILIYQLWGFIVPALEDSSKWKTRSNTLFITFFFLLGVSFGYLILVPFSLQFFTQFTISNVIVNQFDIGAYFSSLTKWILACGLVFQLPVVSYYLSKFGVLTPELLRKYRKHAIVAEFILAAILTPPDVVSQTLVAIPLLILYEFSIFISKYAVKQRKKAGKA